MDRKTMVVAGVRISAESTLPIRFSERCLPFEAPLDEADAFFYLDSQDPLELPEGVLLAETNNRRLFDCPQGRVLVKYRDYSKREAIWFSVCSGTIPVSYQIRFKSSEKLNEYFNPLFFSELSEFMIRFDAVILHSSLIRCQDCGIVFTAPSQTGKSTQADLWAKYYGADILNGDRSILRKTPDGYQAWGSPYAGSSGIYRNACAPLRAVVVLRQASQNRIRRLETKEAYLCLLSQISVSAISKETIVRQSQWIADLIGQMPVYMLECLPDRGAVELLHDEIKEFFHG